MAVSSHRKHPLVFLFLLELLSLGSLSLWSGKNDTSSSSSFAMALSAVAKRTKNQPIDLNSQLDYVRNGHCVLRQCVNTTRLEKLRKPIMKYAIQKELAAWRQAVQVAANDPNIGKTCLTVEDCQQELANLLGYNSYDEARHQVAIPFLQYFHLWRDLPAVKQLAHDLAPLAGQLMDVDSIRLYQDSLFWKRASDGPTPWHVDSRMAPFDTSDLLTLWIPLQPVPQDGTGLLFCSKSHNDFALPYWHTVENTDSDPESPWNDLSSRYPSDPVDYMPLGIGDVTVHNGWTLHCANCNEDPDSNTDRVALAISYVDGSAPVRRNALDAAVTDNEDLSSYVDWIKDVPALTRNFEHPLVPILWER